MATASKVGIKVTCPLCGDKEATISIDLADVNTCTCSGCSEEFTVFQALKMVEAELARWNAIEAWISLLPAVK